MTRYYCSGFDINNPFGHGLSEMFQSELKNTESIVYIPGGVEKIEKTKNKYIPYFTEHFKNAGIEFEKINLITPELPREQAVNMVNKASFIMLMGGNPLIQKQICENLQITDALKHHEGIMLGFSAGAMLMSKHIIITPCSEEYPDFQIEEGLNLDGISVFPHNNTSCKTYPNELISGNETYQKADLIQVAKKYGKFYLLQDHLRENGLTDVSLIKSSSDKIEFYTENEGKIWQACNNDVVLCYPL